MSVSDRENQTKIHSFSTGCGILAHSGGTRVWSGVGRGGISSLRPLSGVRSPGHLLVLPSQIARTPSGIPEHIFGGGSITHVRDGPPLQGVERVPEVVYLLRFYGEFRLAR